MNRGERIDRLSAAEAWEYEARRSATSIAVDETGVRSIQAALISIALSLQVLAGDVVDRREQDELLAQSLANHPAGRDLPAEESDVPAGWNGTS